MFILVWECAVDEQLRSNRTMKEFFKNSTQIVGRKLDPRDGFYGGRTQAYCLHAEADAATEIAYFDIVSLYPSVNFFAF